MSAGAPTGRTVLLARLDDDGDVLLAEQGHADLLPLPLSVLVEEGASS